ncbi:MAG: alpha-amylase family glycosyl hydrolase [Novosphingobium sp.]
MNAMKATSSTPWWRGAAIYQIYPRSFQDSNGDGVGDLAGITSRLDYVAELGVDAIWISPFYTSPMRDFGYDIADYRAVDPIFGTLADFDALIARAHALGLKVIIDQVYAHSSDLHPWFAESRSARVGPRADWYVWANSKRDGTPPNNWQSVFGGPAWTWDARRGQYYMHTFLKEQPQLNVHNLAVQDALLDVARFWLERGVDGFRLDALNHSMHDPRLRNNPPAPDDGKPRSRPFDFQLRLHSQSQPGVIPFIERIRALCDHYGAIHTVAEVGGDNAQTEIAAYTRGEKRLNSAYGFDFLYATELTPAVIAEVLAAWEGDGKRAGWPSWAFENHDAPRAVSRWCAPDQADSFARVKMALLLALRGNVILYQGEELGLRQDHIPFEQLQDPEAIANWPLTLGRDGARTPMPWLSDRQFGGFTTGHPWLPLSPQNLALSVAAQKADSASLLHLTQHLLALRRDNAALRIGGIENVCADEALLCFDRVAGRQRLRCVFNLSTDARKPPAMPPHCTLIASVNAASLASMPGYSALYLDL